MRSSCRRRGFERARSTLNRSKFTTEDAEDAEGNAVTIHGNENMAIVVRGFRVPPFPPFLRGDF